MDKNYVEGAIRKAIEGGYNIESKSACFAKARKDYCESLWTSVVLLDPIFWQALGKSLGWGESELREGTEAIPYWKLHWHRFIDHLAANGSPDDFFKSLLNE